MSETREYFSRSEQHGDVFIAEESSSGSHYNKVKAEDVGRFVEEEIKNLMDHR